MGKGKKKGLEKALGINSDDLLDLAVASLKKYRRITNQIGKMSTGQKVVGGLALLAAGLTYLAKQPSLDATRPKAAPEKLPEADAASAEPAAVKTPAHQRKKAHHHGA